MSRRNPEHGDAGPRAWTGLVVLMLPLFVLSIDVSVLYLAAPHLDVALRPSPTQLLWILDIYGFVIAGSLLTMGRIADRIGARRLLMIGSSLFAAASVAAAFAPSAEWLIACRAAMGLSGATLMPSTLALIKAMFTDEHQRRRAVAIWMSVFSGGVAVGPVIGGAILEAFWWGAVFLLALPPMAAVVLAGPFLLPEQREERPGRVDLMSVGLSYSAMLALVWALKQVAAGENVGWAVPVALLGLISGWAFWRRQPRLRKPLLDRTLFEVPRLRRAVLLLFSGLLVVNAVFYLYPQLLQLDLGLSVLVAGLWVMPVAVSSMLATLATPLLVRRFGVERVIATGLAVAASGLGAAAVASLIGGLPALVVAVAWTVIGVAPLPTLATDQVIGAAPADRAGSASALTETAGELAVGLSVALVGSLVIAAGALDRGLLVTGILGAGLIGGLALREARTGGSAA